MNPDDQNQGSGQTSSPAPAAQKCATCGQGAAGYKCAVCGEESETHDETHTCGGTNCQLKCVGCSQAESKCSCQQAQGESGPAVGGGEPQQGAPAM